MEDLIQLFNTMKQCTKCRKVKPNEQYSKNIRNKSGLKATCKECDSLFAKHRYKLVGRTEYIQKCKT